MRIRELLENTNFKETDFIKKTGDKHELDFDLVDDLLHFMHNDDHAYRRHVYPAVIKCIDVIKTKQPTHSKMFAEAIRECYKQYKKKFPIRILPDELEEETLKKACSKFHDDLKEHVKAGKYKD
jgi:hypothetical protein